MVISGKFYAKKHSDQLFFPQKKIPSDIPKWSFSRFWDRTWNPFRESKFFFSQNLTYLYSFLGWNSPGITMSSESLHNYFGITVKSWKNDEKFGFFEFWLWSRILTVCLSACTWTFSVDKITFEGVSGSKKNLVGVFYVWNVGLVLKSKSWSWSWSWTRFWLWQKLCGTTPNLVDICRTLSINFSNDFDIEILILILKKKSEKIL